MSALPVMTSETTISSCSHAKTRTPGKWKIVRYSINIVKPYIVSVSPRLYLYFILRQKAKNG